MTVDHVTSKLENIISGHRISADDADWLRAAVQAPAEGDALIQQALLSELLDRVENDEIATGGDPKHPLMLGYDTALTRLAA